MWWLEQEDPPYHRVGRYSSRTKQYHLVLEKSLTAYAHLKPTHVVTFDANGGAFKNGKTTKQVEYLDAEYVPLGGIDGDKMPQFPLHPDNANQPPIRDGYVFNGWWTKKNGGT